MSLVNTEYWREEAKTFQKEGTYCRFPKGSYQYREYWEEQTRRCTEGYSVGGVKIPGVYYYYLNFYPILGKDEKTNKKTRIFPRVTDVDFEFFSELEQAKTEGKGFILVKPRRTGFSFKNSALLTHEYNFYREAQCWIGAFQSDLAETTFSMGLQGLNFINENTAWKKNRDPDTREYVKARIKIKTEEGDIWKGYNSSIGRLTFKDNPFAAIGKSANIFIFEEAGRWPGLIQSYNITEPCWRDGADMIGMPVIFGTGGDMEGGTEEFHEMFYNPEKYNLKAFDNVWDDEVTSSKCGWFFPAYKMRFGTYKDPFKEHPEWKGIEMVDSNGNSVTDVAKQDILDFRRIKEQGVDQKAKQDAITQYPFTPKEAFLSNTVSRFPVSKLKAIRASLTDEELNKHQTGKLVFKDGKLVFENVQDEVPFREYPVKSPREGCIEMYETPKTSEDNIFNIRRYIAGIDPYNYDVSKSESVGCILIYDRITQRIVAEYTGKPEKTEKFYEICRRLLLFYEATGLYEANLTALYHYFEKKKSLNLLEDTPTSVRDRSVWKPNTNTSKGIIATKQVNDKGLEFIENWLKAPISENSDDVNMDKIRSVGLLEELIKWEPDPRKNYDRISAFSMVMWFDQTLSEYQEQERAAKNAKSKFGSHFNKFRKIPLENYNTQFKIEND